MSRPQPYHHGDLSAALEQAAVDLLTEQGTSAVSLRAVARRVGVSHNAPYHHFGDRQGLLKAVAARGMRELLGTMTAAREGASSERDRLLAAGEAYVEFAISRPALFKIIFDPEVCDPREPHPVTAPFVEANDEFLSATVRAALPPGTPKQTIAATAAAMWGTVHGLAVLAAGGYLDGETAGAGWKALLTVRLTD